MKKIRVYLQKAWKFSGESPYDKSLLYNPPKNIEYIKPKILSSVQSTRKIKFLNLIKKNIKIAIRKIHPSMPNAHYTKNSKEFDLIHCIGCLSKNKKPWICNIEFVGNFWASAPYKDYPSRKEIMRYILSPYCKKIITWTKWCAEDVIKIFPEIKDKINVIYPAVPVKKYKKIKRKKIILLFISRKFYFKGGLYAIEVMDRLSKKYKNVEGWIVSNVPKEVINKYSKNNQIKFLGTMPLEELYKKVYASANILIYPSFTDTFGFAIPQAMSFGLPVISVDGQSRKELITEGKTGFIIKKPLWKLKDLERLNLKKTLRELERKTEKLIKDKKLREKISENALKEVEKGKFSIRERNKKLIKIYEEVLE